MALAMTTCVPVLSFRALGLDSTRHYHHHYHPSPTRVFKNSLTCTRGGLNNSSSQLPAYDRSRRGFKVLCEAINYDDKEVDHVHETKEAVENVHDGFVGKPIVIRSRATIPPSGSSLLMLTDKENLIGNPEDNHESRELGDPRLRFLLEESRKFKGLVHIKSCYNNRYWVRKRSTGTGFLDTIAAESEKPEEDQSKPSCTLFEPVYARNEGHVCKLRCLGSENGALFLTLDGGQLSLSKSHTLLFEIVEWDKMVIFPKYVTFKDANGYLSAGNTQGLTHLQFASQDITDRTIGNEVFVNEDGTIRIKSTHLDKFWKRSPDGILCDTEEKDSFQPDCLFRPVKLGDNVVALCNLGNNQFCKGLTT
ncbi:hypothetical protein Sjap_016036 [Stephania japonica]|uniref:Agglutinin domain-containing protein n=1 Tax=Stephania japonica TaxID=461633 RepID=A0AAP0IKA1_9MAGN